MNILIEENKKQGERIESVNEIHISMPAEKVEIQFKTCHENVFGIMAEYEHTLVLSKEEIEGLVKMLQGCYCDRLIYNKFRIFKAK